MKAALIPTLFTIFVWWFSTGLILWLDRLSPKFFRWIMTINTVVLFAAFMGLYISSQKATVADAYCGFCCALLIWAWQEVAFLLGYVTGSRRTPCPDGAKGWIRAKYAFEALNHHELGLLFLFAGVVICSWNAENQTGFWTFIILWIMRQSAKLNIFFGVLNLNENFLPKHLKYLQSYFRRRSMNYLMPISLIISLLFVIPLWSGALVDGPPSYQMTSQAILAALLSLAMIEHLFLVIPFQLEFLWKWGFREEG